MTPAPLRLVIFDCDGVLVDSEPASARVLLREAARIGWTLSDEIAHGFIGLRWSDLQPAFETAAGTALGPDWPLLMQERVIAEMDGNVTEIPGAAAALRTTAALGLPYRIASNSSHEEMAAKFAATGLTGLAAGRTHSARDVGVGKPAPDLFLAAAAAEGIPPAACLVVEDSRPGVLAARAAGMACILYAPHGDRLGLAALGAHPVSSLAALPALFAIAMLECAA
jgi:beta-phosphoglucomutase-like phosphatase (HAD superfamily)